MRLMKNIKKKLNINMALRMNSKAKEGISKTTIPSKINLYVNIIKCNFLIKNKQFLEKRKEKR